MRIRKLTSFKDKLVCLMFAKKITPTYFETRFGIHTFFMLHKIDVVILDNNFVVQIVKHNLAPWRIFVWNPKYFRVLELPNGYAKKQKIQKGNKLKLEFI